MLLSACPSRYDASALCRAHSLPCSGLHRVYYILELYLEPFYLKSDILKFMEKKGSNGTPTF